MREIMTRLISGVLSVLVSAGLVGGVVADVTPEQMYDIVFNETASLENEEALRAELGLSVEEFEIFKNDLEDASNMDYNHMDGSEFEAYTKLMDFTPEQENILKEMGIWIDWSDFDWGNFSLDAFAKKITFYDKWMENIDFINNMTEELNSLEFSY